MDHGPPVHILKLLAFYREMAASSGSNKEKEIWLNQARFVQGLINSHGESVQVRTVGVYARSRVVRPDPYPETKPTAEMKDKATDVYTNLMNRIKPGGAVR